MFLIKSLRCKKQRAERRGAQRRGRHRVRPLALEKPDPEDNNDVNERPKPKVGCKRHHANV